MRSAFMAILALSLLLSTPGCALAQNLRDLEEAKQELKDLKESGSDTTETEARIANLEDQLRELRAKYVALGKEVGGSMGGLPGSAAGGAGVFGILKLIEKFLANGKKKTT